MSVAPVLLIGGTGALGSRIAAWLRTRHSTLPLAIAARDQARARHVADSLDHAVAVAVDLGREDLGVPGQAFSMVIPAFKDHSHAAVRFAQRQGLPTIALSEAAFEIAPLIAMYAHNPGSALALVGHAHGGLPAMIALSLSRSFASIESIALGAIFDPADPLPPGAEEDMARIMRSGPPPLARLDGRWRWLPPEAYRPIRRADEEEVPAEPAGLTDSLGLWSPTGAGSVQLDMGFAPTATGTDGKPGHEVVIAIAGRAHNGDAIAKRWILSDPDGNVAFGAKGLTLVAERLLHLGGEPPIGPGLYFPETLLAADWVHAQLPSLRLTLEEVT